MRLEDDGSVERETATATGKLEAVALELLDREGSRTAVVLRAEFVSAGTDPGDDTNGSERDARNQLRARVLAAQRAELVRMRDESEIGDDTYHLIEERLDVSEVSVR